MSIPDLTQKVVKDVLQLSDGTKLELSRSPGASDADWEETKRYLENNPEEARRWDAYAKDCTQVRAHLQTTAFQDYYQVKVNQGDEMTWNKIQALERNPDFATIFEEIKRGGTQAAMQYYYNEPLMMKLSRAVGGVPEETRDGLDKISKSPITLHEASRWGDLSTVKAYVEANGAEVVNDKDAKGISALAYAVGANRSDVVAFLVEKGADVKKVDGSGCSALHYAAAYGRKELAEYLVGAGCEVALKNTQGQTALDLATKNKQLAAAEVLRAKGAA